MIKWLHHLFNPHCSECRIELECESCSMLLTQLQAERREKKELLDQILILTKPAPIEKVEPLNSEELTPINRGHTPWRVRQQLLEAEDRAKARLMENKPINMNDITELERELGVTDATGKETAS